MLESFVAKIIHATVKLKTKLLIVEDKAYIKTLDAEKIVDNGSVYGKSADIRGLVVEPELGPGELPSPGKNCNFEGNIAKPSRADHTHRIPGKAKENLYGHVKLSDSVNSDYGVDDGYAATPKAIQTIGNNCLKLDGTSQMAGMIKTVGNPSNVVFENAKHAIKIGSNSYISDLGNDGVAHIMSAGNPAVGALAFGKNLSTILLSKNNGHLYLRNRSANGDYTDEEGHTLTVDGERMILDYTVEAFMGKNATFYWTPARTGWYRVYLVGAGGKGAPGVAQAVSAALGSFAKKNSDGSTIVAPHNDYASWKNYTHPEQSIGLAVAGAGGGGGGVAVVDIYVPADPYCYIAQKNGSISVEYVNDNGEIATATETCYIEKAIPKMATIKINSNLTSITNLFALTGAQKRVDDSIYNDEGSTEGDAEVPDDGEDDTVEIEDLQVNAQTIYAFKGMNAVVGTIKVQRFSKKTLLNGGTSISPISGLGDPTSYQFYGIKVYADFRDNSHADKITGTSYTDVKQGWYYLRFGKRWGGTKPSIFNTGTDARAVWCCYDSNNRERYRVEHGAAGTVGSFAWLIAKDTQVKAKSPFKNGSPEAAVATKYTTAMLEAVGPSFVGGYVCGVPYVDPSYFKNIPDTSTTNIYETLTVQFSAAGLGGNATGGDVNFVGGSGDVPTKSGEETYGRTGQDKPLKPTTDNTDNIMSSVVDVINPKNCNNSSSSKNKIRVRADGYCGGVPGRIGVTGAYGALGGAGNIIQSTLYKGTQKPDTRGGVAYAKCGVIYGRCGYGSGLSIADLGNYSGDLSEVKAGYTTKMPAIPAKTSGYGYYGGGSGGGAAIVGSKSGGNGTRVVGAAGAPGGGCVVIGYYGDCKPKNPTNLAGKDKIVDSNGDGIDDKLEVILTYVADSNGSVEKLEYDQSKTGVPLKLPNGELSEWGTGTITAEHRPTVVTPAEGYKTTPIYRPSITTIDNSFDGVITVSFERDSNKWFTVEFSCYGGGTLEPPENGALFYQDVVNNSPLIPPGESGPLLVGPKKTRVYMPTPVPDEGYMFSHWMEDNSGEVILYPPTALPEKVTRRHTFIAEFVPIPEPDAGETS